MENYRDSDVSTIIPDMCLHWKRLFIDTNIFSNSITCKLWYNSQHTTLFMFKTEWLN